MQASSVVKLMELLRSASPEAMYRGQLDKSWELLPSICRYAAQADLLSGYDAIVHLEQHLIDKFLQYSVSLQDLRSCSKVEQLLYLQHYGVPTRLLDWSSNPLKALFFAVENPAYDTFDGVVFAFQPKGWWEGTRQVPLDVLGVFFPELFHERLSAQDACFVSFPLPDAGFNVRPLSKRHYGREVECLTRLVVPASSKVSIRRELAVLGVSHRTIYPGLDGVGRWVKSLLSDFVA